MRQSAQCLSLGRSSSSSSFGSSNKLFGGGGIYSSAPESALEITSVATAPTVPDWQLDGAFRNMESANCSMQQQQHQQGPAPNSACFSRFPKTLLNLKKWRMKTTAEEGKEMAVTSMPMPMSSSSSSPSSTAGPCCQCPPSSAITPFQQQ
uniref:Uncharacterized protein n=1 Tax=Globodera rostochiensis TaxID=31243 RepID=A0A914I6D1_GLORO